MKKHFVLLFAIAGLLACNQKKSALTVSYGMVQRIHDCNSKYLPNRTVDVWLPDDFRRDNDYKVLYMHDGQMLFDTSITWNKQEWGVDETIGKLLNEGKIHNTIVVGIHNGDDSRRSEYWPQKPFQSLDSTYQNYLLNDAERSKGVPLFFNKQVSSDNYLKYIVEELKPFIKLPKKPNKN